MPLSLRTLHDSLAADPGLLSSIPQDQLAAGLAAAAELNRILLLMIQQTGVNNDGLISPEDMQAISDAIWQPANAQPWREFWLAHGNDSGTVETGYHLLQNDGGTLQFRGRSFADTVADGIYHFGFQVQDGRYVNEDGNDNETLRDVAGWLNYFLNGRSLVWGTDGDDMLGSGDYSAAFAAARSETFHGLAGNDQIWGGSGRDAIYGGDGHDRAGGGEADDRLLGQDGRDTLWGDTGDDRLFGGAGDDVTGGGDGNDRIEGASGNDAMGGDAGLDTLAGGDGDDLLSGGDDDDDLSGDGGLDRLSGGAGGDRLAGGNGADTLSGGEGADRLQGGGGADLIHLWEAAGAVDTVVLKPGDSGLARGGIDRIEGFDAATDLIDLRALGVRSLEDLDYRRDGLASCFYDGAFLRIDADGDARTDMIVEFAWVNQLSAANFLFA